MFNVILKELSLNPKDKLKVLESIDETLFEKSFQPHFQIFENDKPIYRGNVVSSGVGCGYLASTISNKKNQILVTEKISPSQMSQFHSLTGIITMDEDSTTHAAIVARDRGLPVIAIGNAFKLLKDDLKNNLLNGKISLDCFLGAIFIGDKTIIKPRLNESFYSLMNTLKKVSKIKIHANADDSKGAIDAHLMSAEGIQPRAEYMIYTKKGLLALRKILFKFNDSSIDEGLTELEDVFSESLFKISKSIVDKDVVIRLLDPPIHEFLPHNERELQELSRELNVPISELNMRIDQLTEINPMSGNRGARLLIMEPRLLQVQIRSIFKTSKRLKNINRNNLFIINIPMVTVGEEILFIKKQIELLHKEYPSAKYKLGSMIETPASAILPEDIFKNVDYISFGTNDLTAQTFAFSRGDVYEKFLSEYLGQKIFTDDPFSTLNSHVKLLIQNCTKRMSKFPNIQDITICGEQSGETATIEFCVKEKINIISCSPFKIPLTLLRSAIESLKNQ